MPMIAPLKATDRRVGPQLAGAVHEHTSKLGRAVDGYTGGGQIGMFTVVDLHTGYRKSGSTKIRVDLFAQAGQIGPRAQNGKTRKRFASRHGSRTHTSATQEEVE